MDITNSTISFSVKEVMKSSLMMSFKKLTKEDIPTHYTVIYMTSDCQLKCLQCFCLGPYWHIFSF